MQISLRPPLRPEYVEYTNTPRESLNTVRNCLRNTLKQYPKLTSLKSPTHPHPYPQTNFIPWLTSLNKMGSEVWKITRKMFKKHNYWRHARIGHLRWFKMHGSYWTHTKHAQSLQTLLRVSMEQSIPTWKGLCFLKG